jgi:hypothetical protein
MLQGLPDAGMRKLAKTCGSGQMLRISAVSDVPPKSRRDS